MQALFIKLTNHFWQEIGANPDFLPDFSLSPGDWAL